MNDYEKGKALIKKYSYFPHYIVGNPDINTPLFSKFDYHKVKIGDLLQTSGGLILKTQYQRLQLTNNLITYFYHFGLKEVGKGKIKDINKKNNTEINSIIIVLEKIGKLKF